MKSSFAILFLFCFFVSMNTSLFAQEAQGNVFVVTNFERAFPDNGSARELDSLATLYVNKCFGSDNQYVVSCKLLRHWWGHDNRDFIQLVEVKSWDDVTKANQRSNELFEKAWSTEQARDEFNDAYNKYFTGKHSDEIYREVVFTK
ncbi:MAG: hypothetical protein P8X47_01390 [Ignavibacteriaceae bacterium]|jgi:hypothetical protein